MHPTLLSVIFTLVAAVATSEPPHQFPLPPPPAMMDLSFAHRMIVCKSDDDNKAMVEAAKQQSPGGLEQKHAEFVANHQCLPGWVYVNSVTTGESKDLGTVMIDGIQRHFFSMHVGNVNGEFFCLYDQGDAPDPDFSTAPQTSI